MGTRCQGVGGSDALPTFFLKRVIRGITILIRSACEGRKPFKQLVLLQ